MHNNQLHPLTCIESFAIVVPVALFSVCSFTDELCTCGIRTSGLCFASFPRQQNKSIAEEGPALYPVLSQLHTNGLY